MVNTIFTGDLYIKYTPITIKKLVFDREDDDEKLDFSKFQMDEETFIKGLLYVLKNFDETIECKNPSKIEHYDYSRNLGFYYISREGENIRLTSDTLSIYCLFTDEEETGLSSQKMADYVEFKSMEEVNGHFISLSEFLLNAEYVGLTFESIKDCSDKIVVLYEYKDMYLIMDNDGKYNAISKKHPIMSQYKASEQAFDAIDKKNVYLEIFKQKNSKNGLSLK